MVRLERLRANADFNKIRQFFDNLGRVRLEIAIRLKRHSTA